MDERATIRFTVKAIPNGVEINFEEELYESPHPETPILITHTSALRPLPSYQQYRQLTRSLQQDVIYYSESARVRPTRISLVSGMSPKHIAEMVSIAIENGGYAPEQVDELSADQ